MNEENKSQLDRRKYVRIPAQYVLRQHVFSLSNIGNDDVSAYATAVTKNVSAGGMLFETESIYEIGTLLKVELDIPGWEKFKTEFYREDILSRSKPVIVIASVVRVEVIEPNARYDIGACFVGIDEGHQLALAKCLESR